MFINLINKLFHKHPPESRKYNENGTIKSNRPKQIHKFLDLSTNTFKYFFKYPELKRKAFFLIIVCLILKCGTCHTTYKLWQTI